MFANYPQRREIAVHMSHSGTTTAHLGNVRSSYMEVVVATEIDLLQRRSAWMLVLVRCVPPV